MIIVSNSYVTVIMIHLQATLFPYAKIVIKILYLCTILWIYYITNANDGEQEKKQKETLTRKQEKNKSKAQREDEDAAAPTALLQRPKDYIVKFSFPDPPPLQPPILGLHSTYTPLF